MGSSASGSSAGSKAEDRTPRELQRAATGLQQRPESKPGIIDTIAMDLGLKGQTTAYQATLADRQAKSSMMSGSGGQDRDEPQAMTQTAAQTGGGGQTAPATVGSETPGEARLGIRKDPSGQVIGRSMQPDTGKSATQEFVSSEAPGWFRSDIYDATVNALEAGKPLENYRIEGRGTQGTLTIVFDDGTRVATGFRDSKDVRAHADQMVALGKKYQAAGISGAGAEKEPTQLEKAQTGLNISVDELTMDPGERAARERAAGTPAMDLGTAAGAVAERAAAEQTATSQAEREAADALLKGRRSTILTTPGGLLAPSEEQVTAGRSLIGGSRRRREMT